MKEMYAWRDCRIENPAKGKIQFKGRHDFEGVINLGTIRNDESSKPNLARVTHPLILHIYLSPHLMKIDTDEHEADF